MNSFAIGAPEILLTLGALVLMLVAAWRGERSTVFVGWAAVVLLAVAALLLTGVAGSGGSAFNDLYTGDRFAAFAKSLIYVATAAAILVAPGFFGRTAGEALKPEYPVLILLATVGAGMMVSASDLLTLYVGLELQSLASYVLASFMRRDTRSAEAGLKYFVLGALASGILLYGISLLYGFTGTTNFAGVARAFDSGAGIGALFGLVFVFAGLAFKMSAVPFHMWTPDVYEGAPTPVTMLFASAQKVAALALAVRVAVVAMGPATDEWRQIVVFAALASIVLGALGAIGQKNVKRLLAYSSINNVGFALLGLAAGTREGVAAVLVYLAIYMVMTVGAFACVLAMRDEAGRPVESVAALAGLSRTHKGLAAGFAIFMFSLAGIPPLFGFWGKFVVFDALVANGFVLLAAIGIAASVIGAFYYLRIIKTIYFDAPAARIAPMRTIEAALIGMAAAVILGGYIAIPALDRVASAAAASIR